MQKLYIERLIKRFRKDYTVHNWIEVSRSAVLDNFDLFSRGELAVIPVLKGNAYGHGYETIAEILKARTMPYIVVDGYYEALRIRKVSKQPILIMGAIAPENFARINYDGFAFVVHDEAAIHALGKTKKRVKIHLELNTGMNRYGAAGDALDGIVDCIRKYDNLTLEGVMSHLADSDGDDSATVRQAVKRFDMCVEYLHSMGVRPSLIHLAQTAGSVVAKSRYANTMRLGIGLYGVNPFAAEHPLHDSLRDLRPALAFKSTITQVNELKKGDGVSYNYTFKAPKAMREGVLPVGYYEGVNRSLSNAGQVSVGSVNVPIIGRVCMNHTMIDLGATDAKVGDTVTVYSNDPVAPNSIDAISRTHKLFNYNLLTALSPDVRRVIVD